MFKFYPTYDIISEINNQLIKSKYSLQILVDQNDLFFLSENLIKILNKNILIEIVILSNNDTKSLKTVNLYKRLIDGGVNMYWCKNLRYYNDEQFFAIFDRTYVIDTFNTEKKAENAEKFVRNKNSIFRDIVLNSEEIKLLSGNINVTFNADTTIAEKNELVTLNWNVENAHHAFIKPTIGDVPFAGTTEIKVKDDQSYELTATNKESIITKKIFIRVLETKEIDFEITVFDPILNKSLKIEPSTLYDGQYGVYFGQSVKISWDINIFGMLHEDSLGKLTLKNYHEFEIVEKTKFVFTFHSLNGSLKKTLLFHPFENVEVFNRLSPANTEGFTTHTKELNKILKIKFKINGFLDLFLSKFRSR